MNPLTQLKKIRILPLVAFLSGCFIVVTFFWSDWIEVLTGFEPDDHSGSFEWGFAATLLIINMVASMLAWIALYGKCSPMRFGACKTLT